MSNTFQQYNQVLGALSLIFMLVFPIYWIIGYIIAGAYGHLIYFPYKVSES